MVVTKNDPEDGDRAPAVQVAVATAEYAKPAATGSGRDLPNLDVLRSVAVLLVLISHLVEALRSDHTPMFFGAFGVCLFFVHTALVLMWSLARRPHAIDFYIRRIARIYPLSVAVLLITVGLHVKVSPFPNSGEFFVYSHPSMKQVLTHLLLVQNLFSGNIIVYPMWSLPLEVQMYVVLPFFFFFLRKYMHYWPMMLLWAAAVGFSFIHYDATKVNFIVTVPYFISGLIAFVGFSLPRKKYPAWLFLVLLAVVAAIGGSGNWQTAWLPTLALGFMLPSFHQFREGLLTQASWQIARYSYGIYMTHPFAILLAFYLCRNYSWIIQFAVLFGSLAVFAIASFHMIESPCMKLGAKLADAVQKRVVKPFTA